MERSRENVASATMPTQIVDKSSYVKVLSNNGSYLAAKSSPFQVHTVDPLLFFLIFIKFFINKWY